MGIHQHPTEGPCPFRRFGCTTPEDGRLALLHRDAITARAFKENARAGTSVPDPFEGRVFVIA